MWAAVIRKCLTICLHENLLNLIIKIVFDWWLTSWLINSWLQLYLKSLKILIPASVLSESSSRMFVADFFDCIFCVHTAGRGRSWEDQPGVPGWEKRLGCDLLWPEALLWQYLPGAAVRGFRLSVAPSLGPGWDCPDLEHTIALQRRTRLMEMTSAWQRQRGRALREPQSHTLTLSHQEVFF